MYPPSIGFPKVILRLYPFAVKQSCSQDDLAAEQSGGLNE
jgi:hypothetical protein